MSRIPPHAARVVADWPAPPPRHRRARRTREEGAERHPFLMAVARHLHLARQAAASIETPAPAPVRRGRPA